MNISEQIEDARSGNAAAQKCLFDHLADPMLVLCRRYVKSREDAEEILLDGFYKFFKSLPAFHYQGETAMYAWLKKIMVNECLMFLRKKNVFNIIADTPAEEIALEEEALNNLSVTEIINL